MMVDNELGTLPNPVALSTNNMGAFPDTSATADAGAGDKSQDILGVNYVAADQDGYYLYQHDRQADGSATANLTNYVATATTAYYYDVDAQGTVTQYDTSGE